MATWPGSIYAFPAFEDNVDIVQASHQNIPNQELTAIQSSLGVGFTGSFSTLNSLWNSDHLPSGRHDKVLLDNVRMYAPNSGELVISNSATGSLRYVKIVSNSVYTPVTSRELVIGAAGFDTYSGLNPAIRAENVITPTTADGADDNAFTELSPHFIVGDVITGFQALGYVAGGTDRIQLSIRRRQVGTGVLDSTVGTVTYTGANSIGTTTTISNGTLSNSYRYNATVELRSSTLVGCAQFFGMKIFYTRTALI